jgi:hypothetical protein
LSVNHKCVVDCTDWKAPPVGLGTNAVLPGNNDIGEKSEALCRSSACAKVLSVDPRLSRLMAVWGQLPENAIQILAIAEDCGK